MKFQLSVSLVRWLWYSHSMLSNNPVDVRYALTYLFSFNWDTTYIFRFLSYPNQRSMCNSTQLCEYVCNHWLRIQAGILVVPILMTEGIGLIGDGFGLRVCIHVNISGLVLSGREDSVLDNAWCKIFGSMDLRYQVLSLRDQGH